MDYIPLKPMCVYLISHIGKFRRYVKEGLHHLPSSLKERESGREHVMTVTFR